MEIKFKIGVTTPDIEKTLKEDKEFNDYIDKNVKNSKNWVIFANKNFFNKDKIKEYRDIKIIYNNFIQNNTLAILHKNGI